MKKEDLRIVFMGTPEFAVGSLKALVEGGYNVVGVVTQPDRPVGRHGSVLQPPAVKQYALEMGLPVLQPEKMKDENFIAELRALKADLQVVVAFRMLPEIVWAMPRFGTFNVHASLLPQYRGAAPINWAIINGETTTGVTTFFLDHEIDTGRIIMQKTFDIPDDANVEYVYDGLMKLGAETCLETVDAIIGSEGKLNTTPQSECCNVELKPAPKIFKETCRIDFTKTAKEVHDFVRGLSPIPGAWADYSPQRTTFNVESTEAALPVKIYETRKTGITTEKNPGEIKIEKKQMFVATADEWIEILILQMPGKKRMAASDYINGMKH